LQLTQTCLKLAVEVVSHFALSFVGFNPQEEGDVMGLEATLSF